MNLSESEQINIVKPSFEVLTPIHYQDILQRIERYGRTCYKSEDKITDDSAEGFVLMLIKRGHLSVLEHVSLTVRFVCDRGVSHELVRHRIGSYSQESTRYCNYGKKGISFICPFPPAIRKGFEDYETWLQAMRQAAHAYLHLLSLGVKPQIARSVLPNSLKTEVVVTYNLRQWRLFLIQRTAGDAHPQMREIALPVLWRFAEEMPALFDDIARAREI